MNSRPKNGPVRRISTIILNWVVVLCTLGWFASIALTMLKVGKTGFDAPPFYPGIIMVVGLVVTLPLVLLSTAIALMLVGPRRCKLALISLAVYLLPFVPLLWHMISNH